MHEAVPKRPHPHRGHPHLDTVLKMLDSEYVIKLHDICQQSWK